ncbi:uncharacterized protein BX664DRAFT_342903 [Halteromyces radiatus]|uniref:uncharacterized protein n=1 Tax=Halteromyces radiatus TaxID=101107 RepID=UPI00221FC1CB|nr:uncharacterized protein BX664DRAFT_342903 [Halteromyces radiatus]KAI8078862.1 hypothetical protein BX664DRAFT_342903 [Halteromyces radiatus]
MPRPLALAVTPVVAGVAGYAAYVRSTAQPALAHSHIMTVHGADVSGKQQWKKINNGLGLVDVGRSCGGL